MAEEDNSGAKYKIIDVALIPLTIQPDLLPSPAREEIQTLKEKEMVKLTTEEKEIVGNQIVEILMLRKDAENKGRYLTT